MMKFINENAGAITALLLVASMAVGATVWVSTEINDVRGDLNEAERRLAEKIAENAAGIAENAAGIAEINGRLDRIDQRLDLVLEAIANHSHADDGSALFTKPTAQENPADAENENPAAQR